MSYNKDLWFTPPVLPPGVEEMGFSIEKMEKFAIDNNLKALCVEDWERDGIGITFSVGCRSINDGPGHLTTPWLPLWFWAKILNQVAAIPVFDKEN